MFFTPRAFVSHPLPTVPGEQRTSASFTDSRTRLRTDARMTVSPVFQRTPLLIFLLSFSLLPHSSPTLMTQHECCPGPNLLAITPSFDKRPPDRFPVDLGLSGPYDLPSHAGPFYPRAILFAPL